MPEKRATETVPVAPATNGSASTDGAPTASETNGHTVLTVEPAPDVIAVPVAVPVVPVTPAPPPPTPAPAPAPTTSRRARTQAPEDLYEAEVKRAKRYIEDRWDSQKKYYSKKAGQNKKRYQLLQLAVALGGASVPVLISLPNVPNEIPIIISLAVALAAATENVYGYGDDWRAFRQVVEGLKRERALFEAAAGPYRKAREPFVRFVERCEDIIAEETGRYFEREDRSTEEAGSAAAAAAAAPVSSTPYRVTGQSVIQYDEDHADDGLDPNASSSGAG
jgi:hypothetical protein